jgi:hypothetical protein
MAGRLPATCGGVAAGWLMPSGYHSPANCAAVRVPGALVLAAVALSRLAALTSAALRGMPTVSCSFTPGVAGSSGVAASAWPSAISGAHRECLPERVRGGFAART